MKTVPVAHKTRTVTCHYYCHGFFYHWTWEKQSWNHEAFRFFIFFPMACLQPMSLWLFSKKLSMLSGFVLCRCLEVKYRTFSFSNPALGSQVESHTKLQLASCGYWEKRVYKENCDRFPTPPYFSSQASSLLISSTYLVPELGLSRKNEGSQEPLPVRPVGLQSSHVQGSDSNATVCLHGQRRTLST